MIRASTLALALAMSAPAMADDAKDFTPVPKCEDISFSASISVFSKADAVGHCRAMEKVLEGVRVQDIRDFETTAYVSCRITDTTLASMTRSSTSLSRSSGSAVCSTSRTMVWHGRPRLAWLRSHEGGRLALHRPHVPEGRRTVGQDAIRRWPNQYDVLHARRSASAGRRMTCASSTAFHLATDSALKFSQHIGGPRKPLQPVYRGGMMRRPVYAFAGAMGALPVPARAIMSIPLVILGAFSLVFYAELIAGALRMG